MRIVNDHMITADFIVNEVCNDTYDDAGILKDKYYRWLFRVWNDLNHDFIRTKRTVILPIASRTKIVQLPADYQDFIFLGYTDDCGNLIPLQVNPNLAPQQGVENANICQTCGQVDLCAALDMQEIVEDVSVNGVPYTRTTTRILHQDGSYTEEVAEPVALYSGSTPQGPSTPSDLTIASQSDIGFGIVAHRAYFTGTPAAGDAVNVNFSFSPNDIDPPTPYGISVLSLAGWTTEQLLDSVLTHILATGVPFGSVTQSGDQWLLQFSAWQLTASVIVFKAAQTGVAMQTTKRVVCQLDTPCDDCVAMTPGNLAMLSNCGCSDAMMCCPTDMLPKQVVPDIGHYNLLEEEGFIQFSPNTCLQKIFLKYVSSGICKNNIWYFPSIALNALIDGTYLLSIEKKKNIPAIEKQRAQQKFIADEKKIVKRMTRLSGQEFMEIINSIPRIPTL